MTHGSAEMNLGEFKAKLRNFKTSEDTDSVTEATGERLLKARTATKKKTGLPTELACWRCGEKGHRKDECRKKVWCSFCKNKSHTDKVCRKKKEHEQSSRCACAQDGGCGGHLKANHDHGRDDSQGPTSEDFTLRVEADVQQQQISKSGFIVDTGASSHIINDRSRF